MKLEKMSRIPILLLLVGLFFCSGNVRADNGLIPTKRSIEIFQKRVDKRPSDFRSAIVLAQLFMRQAKENDDFDAYVRAESTLLMATEHSPDSTEAKAYLAATLMAQHRFAEALSIAQSVLERDSNSKIALSIVGDAQLQLGNYSMGKIAYEKLLELQDSPTANIRLARYHELNGNIDQAIELAKRSLEQQKQKYSLESIEGWYQWRLAKLHFDHGRIEEAKTYLDASLCLVPHDAESHALLGKVLYFQGETESAIMHLKSAIAVAEKPPFLIMLGNIYRHEGRKLEAANAYDRASELMTEEAEHPKAGPAHARERAAFLLDQNKNLVLALSLAKQDFELRNDLFCHDLLAWAHYKNGNVRQAKVSIDRALAVGSNDAKVFFHAGMIEAELGNIDAAIENLEAALRANPYFSIRGAEIAAETLKGLKG